MTTSRKILRDVRDFIRQPYAWPGMYPKILIMRDGGLLCAKCVGSNYRLISESTRHRLGDGWEASGIDLFMEGPSLPCDHCNDEIESAYGDPDGDEGV